MNSTSNPSTLWCVLIRTLVLLSSLYFLEGYAQGQDSAPVHIKAEEAGYVEDNSNQEVLPTDCVDSNTHSLKETYRHLVSSQPSNVCLVDDESAQAELHQRTKRPKCIAGEGCDVPLNCANYTDIDLALGVPQVVLTSPIELQNIVENPNVSNNCILVMFFAPWCEYSIQFARRYNTIGRMFRELPVLAVDLSTNDPHKYVLAYLPVVAFYHRSKVIYRFKLTETVDELKDMIVKMTEFPAVNVSIDDRESEGPVPVIRAKEETPILYLSIAWIVFVVLVLAARTSRVSDCLFRFVNRTT